MMNKINISEDLHIFRSVNGIVLIRPEELTDRSVPMYQNMNHTIKSIVNLPYHIYFYDLNNSFQLANDLCAEACGFDSSKATLNKSLFDTGKQESAKIICENNNEVMKINKMKIVEEELFLKNGSHSGQALSIKLPWYNKRHETIGVFGISGVFGKQKLDELLSHTLDIGLLSQDKYSLNILSTKFDFSKREKEIIHLLMKKTSAKEIGYHLGVSYRTIEKHIENIKNKLNVKSKSDIIPKIMNNKIT